MLVRTKKYRMIDDFILIPTNVKGLRTIAFSTRICYRKITTDFCTQTILPSLLLLLQYAECEWFFYSCNIVCFIF